jgi:hypothetical protein
MKVNIVVKTLLNGSVSSSSFTASTNGTLVIAGQEKPIAMQNQEE